MIINNAASRSDVDFWTKHLQNTEQNERAELKEIRGLRADTLREALEEMQRQARINPRVKNFLYHADFNPCPHEHLTEKDRDRAFEIFEEERGIPPGTPRIVMEHVKNGRKHWHVIWFRLNENGRPFRDGLDAKVAHTAAREIEKELNLEKVISPLTREPGQPRPPRAPEPWEMYRGMQSGIDPRDVTAEVTALREQSDTGRAFQAALEQHGYQLVTGDRGLLILDSAGKEHSLARRSGMKAKELNEFMRDVDRSALPTLEQAKELYQERKIAGLEADRETVRYEIEWEEKLAQAALEKEKIEGRFLAPEDREKEARAGHQPEPQERAAIEKENVIRMYRGIGENVGPAHQGNELHFSTDQARAAAFGKVYYVDVTREDMAKFEPAHGQRFQQFQTIAQNDWVTADPDIIARLKPLQSAPANAPEMEKQPNWNRDRANQSWEDAVINAAIEQEKIERQFVDPRAGRTGAGHEAEMEARGGREKKQKPPTKGPALHIWNAIQYSDSPAAFAAALREKGIDLAAPTNDEATRSRIAAAYPKQIGNFMPEYRSGEVVAITERGQVWQLNPRTTGKTRDEIEAFLEPLKNELQGIEATKQMQQRRREEIHWPTMPPQPEPITTSPRYHFEDAARDIAEPRPNEQPQSKPRSGDIRTQKAEHAAMLDERTKKGASQPNAKAFAEELERHGLAFASVTADEAYRSHREAEFAKAIGNYAPRFKEGEIVAVTEPGLQYHGDGQWKEPPRVHKLDPAKAEKYLALLSIDRKQLQGIDATKSMLDARAEQRAAKWETIRHEKATNINDLAPQRSARQPKAPRITAAPSLAFGAVGKSLDIVSNIFESILAPKLTPEQIRQGEIATDKRNAEAENSAEFANHMAQLAQERQNRQSEQAARDRQREIERDR